MSSRLSFWLTAAFVMIFSVLGFRSTVCSLPVQSNDKSQKNEQQSLYFNEAASKKLFETISLAEKGDELFAMNNVVTATNAIAALCDASQRGAKVRVVAGQPLSSWALEQLYNAGIDVLQAAQKNDFHTKTLGLRKSDGTTRVITGSQNASLAAVGDTSKAIFGSNNESIKVATDPKSFFNVKEEVDGYFNIATLQPVLPKTKGPLVVTKRAHKVITPSVKSTRNLSIRHAARDILGSTPTRQHDRHIVSTYTLSEQSIIDELVGSSNTDLYVDQNGMSTQTEQYLLEKMHKKNGNRVFIVRVRGVHHSKIMARTNFHDVSRNVLLMLTNNLSARGINPDCQTNHGVMTNLNSTDQTVLFDHFEGLHKNGSVYELGAKKPCLEMLLSQSKQAAMSDGQPMVPARRSLLDDMNDVVVENGGAEKITMPQKANALATVPSIVPTHSVGVVPEQMVSVVKITSPLKNAIASAVASPLGKRQKTEHKPSPEAALDKTSTAIEPVIPTPNQTNPPIFAALAAPMISFAKAVSPIKAALAHVVPVVQSATPKKDIPSVVITPKASVASPEPLVQNGSALVKTLPTIMSREEIVSYCHTSATACTGGCSKNKLEPILTLDGSFNAACRDLGFDVVVGRKPSKKLHSMGDVRTALTFLLRQEREKLDRYTNTFLDACKKNPALLNEVQGGAEWIDQQWKSRCEKIRLLAHVQGALWTPDFDEKGPDLAKQEKRITAFIANPPVAPQAPRLHPQNNPIVVPSLHQGPLPLTKTAHALYHRAGDEQSQSRMAPPLPPRLRPQYNPPAVPRDREPLLSWSHNALYNPQQHQQPCR